MHTHTHTHTEPIHQSDAHTHTHTHTEPIHQSDAHTYQPTYLPGEEGAGHGVWNVQFDNFPSAVP